MMIRLRIDQHHPGESLFNNVFNRNEIHAQQASHRYVVRTFNNVNIGNGYPGDPSPKQSFYRHGAGNGIRIGINQNENMIIVCKLIIKPS